MKQNVKLVFDRIDGVSENISQRANMQVRNGNIAINHLHLDMLAGAILRLYLTELLV